MLRPMKMVRLEVITPIEKTGDVVRILGEKEITNFIDITNVKKEKYEATTEDVNRFEREEFLNQLHNRITNIFKRFDIPYPRPVQLKKEIERVLQDINEKVSSLETDYAEVENILTRLNEERSSIERQILQLDEEHDSAKKFLAENKVDISVIQKLKRDSFGIRDSIIGLHDELQNIQRTLSLADVNRKLTTPHGTIPNDESELKMAYQDINYALLLNQQIQTLSSEATKDVEKLREIIVDTREIVERKLEAVEKLKQLNETVTKAQSYIEILNKNLTKEITRLLGSNFQWQIKEAIKIFEKLPTLKLDTPLDATAHRLGNIINELRRTIGILETSEHFRDLDYTKAVIEKIRRGNIEEIKSAFEEGKTLISNLPNSDLKIIQKAFEIPYMKHRLTELISEPEHLKKKLNELAKSTDFIHAYKEIVEIELILENILKRFRKTERTHIFEAWVKKKDVDNAVSLIKHSCPSAAIKVASEEKGDKPPTYMANPKISEPFEKLVGAYGLPNYREIDPTIITLFTFPIIFGLMFGDVGHGLIILIGGIFLNQIWDKFKLTGEMWDYLRKGRILIIACGIAAIFFGFLYGELFGPTTLHFAHTQKEYWPTWYTALTGLEKGPWLSPLEDLMAFFKITLIIGIIHVFSGIIIDVYNKISAGKIRKAIPSFSWLWFYASLSYIFILIMSPQYSPSEVILNPNILIPFIFVPFAGMIALHKFAIGDTMEALSESIMKGIESLSNTLSYARILALGATHAIFSSLALMGGPSPLKFWMIFFIVTLFMILALEGILTFAHSLRLHWVEWFSKFYIGDGINFEGFTIKRKYTLAQ